MNKGEFNLLSVSKQYDGVYVVEYEAGIFSGTYKKQKLKDVYMKSKGRLLNTAPSVTYYDGLMKAIKKKL